MTTALNWGAQIGLAYPVRLQLLLLYSVLAVVWVRRAVLPLHPGLARLLAVLPVVAANSVLPGLFDGQTEVCTTTAVSFLYLWLCNFKVLGFALNRGPLCTPMKAIQFGAVMLAPITPQHVAGPSGKGHMKRVGSVGTMAASGGSPLQLLSRCLVKTVVLGLVVYTVTTYSLPRVPLEILYAFGLYMFLGFLMDGPASLATSMIGIRIAPHFDTPYFSTSVGNFWGKRWNLTASNSLRTLIYDPLQEGLLVPGPNAHAKSSGLRRAVGLLACFVVSGIVHECIYWYSQGYMTGQWFIFFAMQGPMVLLEVLLLGALRKQGIRIPKPLAILGTLTVLVVMGDMYFFPPCVDTGLADRVVNSIKATFDGLLAAGR